MAEDALEAYEQALSIFEQQLGADHPDTATLLNNLAMLYQDQERKNILPLCKDRVELPASILKKSSNPKWE